MRRYDVPVNSGDYAHAITVDTSGNIYVTGESYGSGTSRDYATIKYYLNGDVILIDKNPKVEYTKFINILLENGITDKNINIQSLNYAYQFFNKLTGYDKFQFNKEYGEVVPTIEDVQFLRRWLDNNQNYLSWNKEKHELELNKI